MIEKSQLIEILTGKNRGLLASKNDHEEILGAIAQLEEKNHHPHQMEKKKIMKSSYL